MLKFSAPKWYITCHSCSKFHPWKINLTVKNSFVFYWFMTCLLACISKSVLATYGGFCGSGSHLFLKMGIILCMRAFISETRIIQWEHYYFLKWALTLWESILKIRDHYVRAKCEKCERKGHSMSYLKMWVNVAATNSIKWCCMLGFCQWQIQMKRASGSHSLYHDRLFCTMLLTSHA